MPDKRTEREGLSTTTVFLPALLIARNLAANDRLRQDDQPGDEVRRLHSWGEVLRWDYSDQLDTMAADVFETVPSPDIDKFESLRRPTSCRDSPRPRVATNYRWPQWPA